MKTQKQQVDSLIRRRLHEAVPHTITAEKVPSGGDATGGMLKAIVPGGATDGGLVGEFDKKEFVVSCKSGEEADSIVQVLKALNTAGASLACTCDGQEVDLTPDEVDDTEEPGELEDEPVLDDPTGYKEGEDEPPAPDGTPEHEEAETPDEEEAEHASGEEAPDEEPAEDVEKFRRPGKKGADKDAK